MPAPLPRSNTADVRKLLEPALKKIEKLIEDRKAIGEDIADAMQDLKGKGFNMKMIREMLKLRAMDSETRSEQEELRDLYMQALSLV